MTETSLSASIASLVPELRQPVTFILSIYEVLDQKLPATAQELWNDLGRISEQVLIEIEDQLVAMLRNIDSYSPAAAAARISELASGWEKEVEQLSRITDKLSGLHVQLEDPKLNKLLNEYLPSSVRGFGRVVSLVRQIRAEDLELD